MWRVDLYSWGAATKMYLDGEHSCRPEVGDLHIPLSVDQNVLTLDVYALVLLESDIPL